MKKNNIFLKCLLAFIVPFIIYLVFFYFKGVFNNVENIFVTDLRRMHIGLLSYFKNILLGKASIHYSLLAGMGSPMVSTVIFYCTSPINLLLLFIKNIEYGIMFVYLVKVSLAGLTMYVFLSKKYNYGGVKTIVFSTCYSLCSFAINNFFAVCWFDSFYLLPLIMYGIEKMFDDEKINLVYIFSLALAIVCNIQMGFSLCIFSVIYFIYSFNIRYSVKDNKDKIKRVGIIFVISSLCSGAISSVALLGFMSNFSNIVKARNLDFGYTNSITTSNILYILKNLFVLGNKKTANYFNFFEPYIYSGLLVAFFSILYLFNNNIDKKKRLHAFFVILFFIFSFCIGFLNKFWHMSVPVGFSFRYSFCFSSFLVMIGYENYINKGKLDKKDIIILSILLFIAIAIVTYYTTSVYVTPTFILMVIMFIFIILAKNKGKIFEIILLLLVFVDLGMNGYYSLTTATDLPIFNYKSLKSFEEIVSKKKIDPGYRVLYNYSYAEHFDDSFVLNKGMTVRYLSSVISSDLLQFLDRNKLSVGNTAYMLSVYNSPLFTSLLGTKYFYVQDELTEPLYQKIDEYKVTNYSFKNKKDIKENVYLYENPYALSLGYVIDHDIKYKKNMDNVDYQNSIIKAFTGVDDVLNKLSVTMINDSSCNTRSYEGCQVYAIHNNTSSNHVYVNGTFLGLSSTDSNDLFYDVDRSALIVSDSGNIYVRAEYYTELNSKSVVAHIYNKDNLVRSLDILKSNMLEDIDVNKNKLSAKLDSDKDGILFLSIPYDNYFQIYVDGKMVDYYSLLDGTFLGLDIKKGKHEIKLIYKDNRIYLYIISSVVAVIITMFLYFLINKKLKKIHEEEEKIKIEIESRKNSKKSGKKIKKKSKK